MTADYLQKSAGSLNTIFQLYKAKIKDLPKESDPEWWDKAREQFEVATHTDDEDVSNFAGLFASACLKDLNCKYTGNKWGVEYHYMSKDMTLEEFGEYLNSPRKGDSFKVLGTRIEIKDVD